ncbi:ATP-binding protein [Nocardia sp. NPDC051990]|uniref:WXG100-like domain-containing protein n=1 Tax=Nocardia sp. NPDC051990 TaxID=3155285 RepID=UPI003429B711
MSDKIPEWAALVEMVEWVVGADWPEGNADQLDRLATDLGEIQGMVQDVIDNDLDDAIAKTIEAYGSSDGADKLAESLEELRSGDSSLAVLAEGIGGLADGCRQFAGQVFAADVSSYVALGIWASEMYLSYTMGPAGVAEKVQSCIRTRIWFAAMGKGVLAAISRMVRKLATKFAGTYVEKLIAKISEKALSKLLYEVLDETLEEIAQGVIEDVIVHATTTAAGYDHKFSDGKFWENVGLNALGGGAGGIAGFGLHHGVEKVFGKMTPAFGNRPFRTRAADGLRSLAIGGGAGLAGALAVNAVTGQLGQMTLKDWLSPALASGTPGMVSGYRFGFSEHDGPQNYDGERYDEQSTFPADGAVSKPESAPSPKGFATATPEANRSGPVAATGKSAPVQAGVSEALPEDHRQRDVEASEDTEADFEGARATALDGPLGDSAPMGTQGIVSAPLDSGHLISGAAPEIWTGPLADSAPTGAELPGAVDGELVDFGETVAADGPLTESSPVGEEADTAAPAFDAIPPAAGQPLGGIAAPIGSPARSAGQAMPKSEQPEADRDAEPALHGISAQLVAPEDSADAIARASAATEAAHGELAGAVRAGRTDSEAVAAPPSDNELVEGGLPTFAISGAASAVEPMGVPTGDTEDSLLGLRTSGDDSHATATMGQLDSAFGGSALYNCAARAAENAAKNLNVKLNHRLDANAGGKRAAGNSGPELAESVGGDWHEGGFASLDVVADLVRAEGKSVIVAIEYASSNADIVGAHAITLYRKGKDVMVYESFGTVESRTLYQPGTYMRGAVYGIVFDSGGTPENKLVPGQPSAARPGVAAPISRVGGWADGQEQSGSTDPPEAGGLGPRTMIPPDRKLQSDLDQAQRAARREAAEFRLAVRNSRFAVVVDRDALPRQLWQAVDEEIARKGPLIGQLFNRIELRRLRAAYDAYAEAADTVLRLRTQARRQAEEVLTQGLVRVKDADHHEIKGVWREPGPPATVQIATVPIDRMLAAGEHRDAALKELLELARQHGVTLNELESPGLSSHVVRQQLSAYPTTVRDELAAAYQRYTDAVTVLEQLTVAAETKTVVVPGVSARLVVTSPLGARALLGWNILELSGPDTTVEYWDIDVDEYGRAWCSRGVAEQPPATADAIPERAVFVPPPKRTPDTQATVRGLAVQVVRAQEEAGTRLAAVRSAAERLFGIDSAARLSPSQLRTEVAAIGAADAHLTETEQADLSHLQDAFDAYDEAADTENILRAEATTKAAHKELKRIDGVPIGDWIRVTDAAVEVVIPVGTPAEAAALSTEQLAALEQDGITVRYHHVRVDIRADGKADTAITTTVHGTPAEATTTEILDTSFDSASAGDYRSDYDALAREAAGVAQRLRALLAIRTQLLRQAGVSPAQDAEALKLMQAQDEIATCTEELTHLDESIAGLSGQWGATLAALGARPVTDAVGLVHGADGTAQGILVLGAHPAPGSGPVEHDRRFGESLRHPEVAAALAFGVPVLYRRVDLDGNISQLAGHVDEDGNVTELDGPKVRRNVWQAPEPMSNGKRGYKLYEFGGDYWDGGPKVLGGDYSARGKKMIIEVGKDSPVRLATRTRRARGRVHVEHTEWQDCTGRWHALTAATPSPTTASEEVTGLRTRRAATDNRLRATQGRLAALAQQLGPVPSRIDPVAVAANEQIQQAQRQAEHLADRRAAFAALHEAGARRISDRIAIVGYGGAATIIVTGTRNDSATDLDTALEAGLQIHGELRTMIQMGANARFQAFTAEPDGTVHHVDLPSPTFGDLAESTRGWTSHGPLWWADSDGALRPIPIPAGPLVESGPAEPIGPVEISSNKAPVPESGPKKEPDPYILPKDPFTFVWGTRGTVDPIAGLLQSDGMPQKYIQDHLIPDGLDPILGPIPDGKYASGVMPGAPPFSSPPYWLPLGIHEEEVFEQQAGMLAHNANTWFRILFMRAPKQQWITAFFQNRPWLANAILRMTRWASDGKWSPDRGLSAQELRADLAAEGIDPTIIDQAIARHNRKAGLRHNIPIIKRLGSYPFFITGVSGAQPMHTVAQTINPLDPIHELTAAGEAGYARREHAKHARWKTVEAWAAQVYDDLRPLDPIHELTAAGEAGYARRLLAERARWEAVEAWAAQVYDDLRSDDRWIAKIAENALKDPDSVERYLGGDGSWVQSKIWTLDTTGSSIPLRPDGSRWLTDANGRPLPIDKLMARLHRIFDHLLHDNMRFADGTIGQLDQVADVARACQRLIDNEPKRFDIILLEAALAEAEFLDAQTSTNKAGDTLSDLIWEQAHLYVTKTLGYDCDSIRPHLDGPMARQSMWGRLTGRRPMAPEFVPEIPVPPPFLPPRGHFPITLAHGDIDGVDRVLKLFAPHLDGYSIKQSISAYSELGDRLRSALRRGDGDVTVNVRTTETAGRRTVRVRITQSAHHNAKVIPTEVPAWTQTFTISVATGSSEMASRPDASAPSASVFDRIAEGELGAPQAMRDPRIGYSDRPSGSPGHQPRPSDSRPRQSPSPPGEDSGATPGTAEPPGLGSGFEPVHPGQRSVQLPPSRPTYQVAQLYDFGDDGPAEPYTITTITLGPDGLFHGPDGEPYNTRRIGDNFLMGSTPGDFHVSTDGDHIDLWRSFPSVADAPAAFGTWHVSEGRLVSVVPASGTFFAASSDPKFVAQLRYELTGHGIDLSAVNFRYAESQGTLWPDLGERSYKPPLATPQDLIKLPPMALDLFRGSGDDFWVNVSLHERIENGLSVTLTLNPVRGEPGSATLVFEQVNDTITARYATIDRGIETARIDRILDALHDRLTQWLEPAGVELEPVDWAVQHEPGQPTVLAGTVVWIPADDNTGPEQVRRGVEQVVAAPIAWPAADLQRIHLAATEVVTNAVRHSGGPVRVVVRVWGVGERQWLSVEVYDTDLTDIPERAMPTAASTGGMGIALLALYTDRHGSQVLTDSDAEWVEGWRKRVYVEFDRPREDNQDPESTGPQPNTSNPHDTDDAGRARTGHSTSALDRIAEGELGAQQAMFIRDPRIGFSDRPAGDPGHQPAPEGRQSGLQQADSVPAVIDLLENHHRLTVAGFDQAGLTVETAREIEAAVSAARTAHPELGLRAVRIGPLAEHEFAVFAAGTLTISDSCITDPTEFRQRWAEEVEFGDQVGVPGRPYYGAALNELCHGLAAAADGYTMHDRIEETLAQRHQQVAPDQDYSNWETRQFPAGSYTDYGDLDHDRALAQSFAAVLHEGIAPSEGQQALYELSSTQEIGTTAELTQPAESERSPDEIDRVADEFATLLRTEGIEAAVFGAAAANAYRAQPRPTADVDILVVDLRQAERWLAASGYPVEVFDRIGMEPDKIATRFNGVLVELIPVEDPLEAVAVQRSAEHGGRISVEDMIIFKLMAWHAQRPQDRDDLVSILSAEHQLDQDYMRQLIAAEDLQMEWAEALHMFRQAVSNDTSDSSPVDISERLDAGGGSDYVAAQPDSDAEGAENSISAASPDIPFQLADNLLSSSASRADPPAPEFAESSRAPEVSRTVLSEGAVNMARRVELITYADGTQRIRKEVTDPRHADAEELAALLGRAVGADVPDVVRTNATVLYIEVMPGMVASRIYGNVWSTQQIQIGDSAAGRRLGLLDVLARVPDRGMTNWLISSDGRISGIDHSLAFGNGPGGDQQTSSGFAAHFLERTADGTVRWRRHDLTELEVTALRQRIQELAPEFERRGRHDWYRSVLEQLARIEQNTRRA